MKTYKIQTNLSATRSMIVSESHLETLREYSLFENLLDSNGIIDESVLDKLKLNVRSILETQTGTNIALLDLCLDVIYNNNMKAFALQQLFQLYKKWEEDNKQASLDK